MAFAGPVLILRGESIGLCSKGLAAVSQVEIYSSMFCPFCYRAKRLLARKGVEFNEIDVDFHPDKWREMTERANGRTSVPQIFIDGRHVGGSDELAALDDAGELDSMLGIAT